MARVPYADPEALPDEYDILDEQADELPSSIDAEYWSNAKTVRAFANNPDLADLHVHTNVSLWTKTGLTDEEVELVILAVARELESRFEWHAHAISAIQRAGVPTETVLAIANRDLDGMDGKTRSLVEYVFAFVRETGAVDDTTHDALAAYYDDGTIVGVVMLAGFYLHLHHVGSALGIEHDEEFVGWNLENMPSDHERYR